MKSVLLLPFLLLTFFAQGQDYRCIIPGEKAYFTNSTQYLTGIRIDSANFYPDSEIYYPFRSQRGAYLGSTTGIFPTDTNGGCWIGKTVRRYNDGTHIFENIWHDSVIIKTIADVGDTWIFYTDTSRIFYRATIATKAPEDVMGVSDTVIRIQIQTFHTDTGFIPSDPANNLVVAISKHYGLVEFFDLYLFPHRLVAATLGSATASQVNDYFYQVRGNQQFGRVAFSNTDLTSISDFSPGDVFAYHGTRNLFGGGTAYRRVDTIFSRTIVGPGTIEYKIHRREIWEPPSSGTHLYSYSQPIVTVNSTPMFDSSLMPEETGIQQLRYYKPGDSSFCSVATMYGRKWPILQYGLGVCPVEEWSKIGLGTTFTTNCFNPDFMTYDATTLDYVNKGTDCGVFDPIPDRIEESPYSEVNSYTLQPNPANEKLILNFSPQTSITFQLTDLFGKTVISGDGKSPVQIDLRSVAPSTYLLVIHDKNGRIYRKKVAVTH